MGAGQSSPSSAHPPGRALHVLRVTPSSPASQTNIEPFFDFVVGFEGDQSSTRDDIDVSELEKIVESHEDTVLNLVIWNSKQRQTRVVPITPSRSWAALPSRDSTSSEQQEGVQPSLLGLSVRMCEPEFALDNVWHVLDVLEDSPAESAGLVPYGDWIIGWSGGALSAEGDFYDLVEAHVDRPLRVYVYSYDFDTLREVVMVPNRHWGGEGLLGCVFGFGLLHRIPAPPPDREPGSLPEELLQPDDEFEEQALFVPADINPEEHSSETQGQAAERKRIELEQWQKEFFATRFNAPDHRHEYHHHHLEHEHDHSHGHIPSTVFERDHSHPYPNEHHHEHDSSHSHDHDQEYLHHIDEHDHEHAHDHGNGHGHGHGHEHGHDLHDHHHDHPELHLNREHLHTYDDHEHSEGQDHVYAHHHDHRDPDAHDDHQDSNAFVHEHDRSSHHHPHSDPADGFSDPEEHAPNPHSPTFTQSIGLGLPTTLPRSDSLNRMPTPSRLGSYMNGLGPARLTSPPLLGLGASMENTIARASTPEGKADSEGAGAEEAAELETEDASSPRASISSVD